VNVEASAPGKLILIGEYAVLFGAPAVVMAVDRRAKVTFESSPSAAWTVGSPGLTQAVGRFEFGEGGAVCWQDPGHGENEFRLVDRLVNGLSAGERAQLAKESPAAMTLDTRSFFATLAGRRRKLGLGSSAALSTALVSGLRLLQKGRACDASDLPSLVELHRGLQYGRGSGVDVAASLLGGALRYQLGDAGPTASAIELPKDLVVRCVWTGRAASTSNFLEALDRAKRRDPAAVAGVLDRLGGLSEIGADALANADSSRFLEAVDDFTPALEALGRVIDMPILSDDHRRVWEVASELGVAYKPSGAGGGDFGLVFWSGPGRGGELESRIATLGYGLVDLGIDTKGASAQTV
jgi:phosphomevalonate kinase